MTKVWRAKNAILRIDRADNIATIDNSANLADFFTAESVSVLSAKDITVTPPEVTADKVDLIGVDTNSFQNVEMEKKPVGMGKITGTLVLDADEDWEYKPTTSSDADKTLLFVAAETTAITSPVAATRYQFLGSQNDVCMLVELIDTATTPDDSVQFAMDNAVLKLGDVKITADGHVERSFELVCLPRDFYMEFYN